MPDDYHALDTAILAVLEREGRVTPGYLQGALRNSSPYVRQRLRALVRMGYVRDLGHALYEREVTKARFSEASGALDSPKGPERGSAATLDRPEAWWRNWRGLSSTGRLEAALAPIEEFVTQMRKRGLPDSRIRRMLRDSW